MHIYMSRCILVQIDIKAEKKQVICINIIIIMMIKRAGYRYVWDLDQELMR